MNVDAGNLLVFALSRWHRLPNLPIRGTCAVRLQKNCDAGNFPVARFVRQVQPHIVWLAVDALFAGTVKVELCQLVAVVSDDEEISPQIRHHSMPLSRERRFVIEAGDALGLEQFGTQGDIAVAFALALVNANHHALTVDVLYLQRAEFFPAYGGGIQRHEERAVIEIAGRVDESSHLLRAEHGRRSLVGFRKWNVLSQKVPAQCLYEQDAQRGHILTDRGRSQLLRLEQMSLILPNLLGPELVRWLVKMLGKIADDAKGLGRSL